MNNTVVTACNPNYLWGAWLLIASMRKNGMKEPALVLGFQFEPAHCRVLEALGDVRVVCQNDFERSLTCSKPEALLLAETEYLTWADCDGFFIGNCSDRLIWPDPGLIHIRQRSVEENDVLFRKVSREKGVPAAVLDIWRRDVGERETPRYDRCCSACFLALHSGHRPFLERWSRQMRTVLPQGDHGVLDTKLFAYFQTDESVLNSLLFYGNDVPAIAPYYQLDKDRSAFFVHFISQPKPWQAWTPASFRFFREYTDLVVWAVEHDYPLPGKIPLSLRQNCYCANRLRSYGAVPLRKLKSLKRRLGI